ncbi:MAG TPA: choice-of-anchor L domain-containing protein, partial [Bacteroidia bacterium]|nr:choice-of-anchor L domain-containing protein [Bacteroidia bacterium]
MKSKVVTFSIVFTLLFFSNTYAQLTVNGHAPYNTIDYLVKNVLLGKGITVTNIEYAGSPIQIGFFNGQKSNLNLDSGIVMTTGSITSAEGPNTVSDSAVVIDTLPMNDPDLLKLSNASSIYDRASIDFDFIANSDSICFKYVFGSEEYMEFVNAGYNDAFGFFLSGPGISGPFSDKAVNLALIPNTET